MLWLMAIARVQLVHTLINAADKSILTPELERMYRRAFNVVGR